MSLFFKSAILILKKRKKKLFASSQNKLVHMKYHLFLHYGWFFQNLEKDFIRTDMHMTLTYKKNLKYVIKIRKSSLKSIKVYDSRFKPK